MFAHGRWFSPGTLSSSATKTGRHDIAEILLKVALNTINQSNQNQSGCKKMVSHILCGIFCTKHTSKKLKNKIKPTLHRLFHCKTLSIYYVIKTYILILISVSLENRLRNIYFYVPANTNIILKTVLLIAIVNYKTMSYFLLNHLKKLQKWSACNIGLYQAAFTIAFYKLKCRLVPNVYEKIQVKYTYIIFLSVWQEFVI
jgi:hypothetical protein